jgi:hypothetical protein
MVLEKFVIKMVKIFIKMKTLKKVIKDYLKILKEKLIKIRKIK